MPAAPAGACSLCGRGRVRGSALDRALELAAPVVVLDEDRLGEAVAQARLGTRGAGAGGAHEEAAVCASHLRRLRRRAAARRRVVSRRPLGNRDGSGGDVVARRSVYRGEAPSEGGVGTPSGVGPPGRSAGGPRRRRGTDSVKRAPEQPGPWDPGVRRAAGLAAGGRAGAGRRSGCRRRASPRRGRHGRGGRKPASAGPSMSWKNRRSRSARRRAA
jgi:hypothetical protein